MQQYLFKIQLVFIVVFIDASNKTVNHREIAKLFGIERDPPIIYWGLTRFNFNVMSKV